MGGSEGERVGELLNSVFCFLFSTFDSLKFRQFSTGCFREFIVVKRELYRQYSGLIRQIVVLSQCSAVFVAVSQLTHSLTHLLLHSLTHSLLLAL